MAEIGCNHNGDKGIAKKMVQAAKECGVDAVKFHASVCNGRRILGIINAESCRLASD